MDQPPVITFNLKERGREHTGVKRNFDIPRIVAAINSPKCQERVRNREMLGYLGHWPRNHFGAIPALGVIAAGNSFPLEPALVTVMLRAYPDGTIEHKTEFLLNNEMGDFNAGPGLTDATGLVGTTTTITAASSRTGTTSSSVPQAAPICRDNITPAAWLARNPWPTSSIGGQLISMFI